MRRFGRLIVSIAQQCNCRNKTQRCIDCANYANRRESLTGAGGYCKKYDGGIGGGDADAAAYRGKVTAAVCV